MLLTRFKALEEWAIQLKKMYLALKKLQICFYKRNIILSIPWDWPQLNQPLQANIHKATENLQAGILKITSLIMVSHRNRKWAKRVCLRKVKNNKKSTLKRKKWKKHHQDKQKVRIAQPIIDLIFKLTLTFFMEKKTSIYYTMINY